MIDRRDIPSIPSQVDPDLKRPLDRMREELQLLLGFRGNDPAIRSSNAGQLGGGSNITIIGGGPGGGGGGTPPAVDLTPPPTPDPFTASPGITTVFLEWGGIGYTQGNGNRRTLIYGVQRLLSDPSLPVFGDAQLLGDALHPLTVFALTSEPARRWHLWITFQTNDGVESVTAAGGVNGLVAQTGQNPADLIAVLTAAAENPSVPYGRLTLRGNLINVADDTGAFSPVFNIVTAPIEQNGVTVPPGVYISSLMVANGTIGNLQLGNAVVDDAKISTLSAVKFTGGEMRVGSFLQSTNYTSGANGDGFRINANGTAELQAAYIRGLLTAEQINTNGMSIRNSLGAVIFDAGTTPSLLGTIRVGAGGPQLQDLAGAPIVRLTGTGAVFVTPSGSTTPAPATHTLTATVSNFTSPTYAWFIDGVAQTAPVPPDQFVVPSFAAGTPARAVRVEVSGTGGTFAFDVLSVFSLKDGSDAFAAGLDNENQTVASNSAGTPLAGQLPLVSKLVVAQGATFITAGVTFSVASSSGFSGVTINATGDISILGITADFAQAVFRAAITGGPTFDRLFTANKSRDGAVGETGPASTVPGPASTVPGPRGSLTGYGFGQYGIVSSAWSNDKANRVIQNILTGATLTTDLTTTTHLRIGDTVTLGNGTTFAEVRFWSGTVWLDPAVVISGNLLVGGTISGGTNINITGFARIEGGLGALIPDPTSGTALSRGVAVLANTTFTQDFGVVGYSNQSGIGGAGVYGINTNSASGGTGVMGRGNLQGVYGFSNGSFGVRGNSDTGFGLRGESNSSTGVSGVSVNAGTGVFGSSSTGVGGRFSGAVALRVDGPTRLEGGGSSMRWKPNAGSALGRAAVLRTDGGGFYIGLTANGVVNGPESGGANGGETHLGLIYNMSTNQMLIDRPGFNNVTVSTGGGTPSFTNLKPGASTANQWMTMEINGSVAYIPIWF